MKMRATLEYEIPEEYEQFYKQTDDLAAAAQNSFGQIINESHDVAGEVVFINAELIDDDDEAAENEDY